MQLGNIPGPVINSATQLNLVIMTNSSHKGEGGGSINWVIHAAENIFKCTNVVQQTMKGRKIVDRSWRIATVYMIAIQYHTAHMM